MRRTLLALLCVGVVLSGCKAKEALDAVAISKDLDKKGTTDLLKEVAKDKYDAPANGHLTDNQIQMYLKVREHEKKIAQVAKQEAQKHANEAKKAGDKSLAGMMEGFKTLGSVADMMTADIRAAKDLGYNTQEYLWVKQQVLAVSASAMVEKMAQVTNASFDSAYQQTKKAYEEAKDEQTKKLYAEMLAGYDKSRQEIQAQQKEQADPAVAHNRQLLAKYENELNAFTSELSKWEDKPGEAQKNVEQWQKNVDKSVADSKKVQ